eukprot:m51a1_g637 hypothetical protein (973) ;mRNA; f:160030-163580
MWSSIPRQKTVFSSLLVFVLRENNGRLYADLLHQYPAAGTPGVREPPKKHAGQFCYPDLDLFAPTGVQRNAGLPYPKTEAEFTFVLTDDAGVRQYAYVRRIMLPAVDLRPVCICLTTPFGWFGFFREMLRHCGNLLAESWTSLAHYASLVYEAHLPQPRCALEVPSCPSPTLVRPSDALLPSSEDLGALVGILGATRASVLFAELLLERRVAFVSSDLSMLTRCVHAAARMVWPFSWQHVFLPVVSVEVLSYVDAPMPFLMGLQRHHYTEATRRSLSEAIVVDADSGEISNVVYDDLSVVPPAQLQALRQSLMRQQREQSCEAISDALRRFLVHTVGNYTKFFVQATEGGRQVARFDRDTFVKAHAKDVRAFLRAFCQSQMFEQFVAEKEEQHTRRQPPRTQFEIDIERDPAAALVSPREVLAYYGGKARQTYKKAAKAVRDYRRSYSRGYLSVSLDHEQPLASQQQQYEDEIENYGDSEDPVLDSLPAEPLPAWQPQAQRHRVPSTPPPPPPPGAGTVVRAASMDVQRIPGPGGRRNSRAVFPISNPLAVRFADVHRTFTPPAAPAGAAQAPALPPPPTVSAPQPRSQQKLIDIDQFFDMLPQHGSENAGAAAASAAGCASSASPSVGTSSRIVFDPFDSIADNSPSPASLSSSGALSSDASPGPFSEPSYSPPPQASLTTGLLEVVAPPPVAPSVSAPLSKPVVSPPLPPNPFTAAAKTPSKPLPVPPPRPGAQAAPAVAGPAQAQKQTLAPPAQQWAMAQPYVSPMMQQQYMLQQQTLQMVAATAQQMHQGQAAPRLPAVQPGRSLPAPPSSSGGQHLQRSMPLLPAPPASQQQHVPAPAPKITATPSFDPFGSIDTALGGDVLEPTPSPIMSPQPAPGAAPGQQAMNQMPSRRLSAGSAMQPSGLTSSGTSLGGQQQRLAGYLTPPRTAGAQGQQAQQQQQTQQPQQQQGSGPTRSPSVDSFLWFQGV